MDKTTYGRGEGLGNKGVYLVKWQYRYNADVIGREEITGLLPTLIIIIDVRTRGYHSATCVPWKR